MKKPYPNIDEEFELTLDGNDPRNQPLAMVSGDVHDSEKDWRHDGPTVTGNQTRKFRLVQVGYCSHWDELRQKLRDKGTIPEGQWRQAFLQAFPGHDGQGPVGVADASWVHPYGAASFPCVASDGNPGFGWAVCDFDGGWRWLVASE
jgi:hypothetical protein